jgi:hypothetical protein
VIRLAHGACALAVALSACSASRGGAMPQAFPDARIHAAQALYQPLKVGDSWTYTCRDIKNGGENGNKPFTIRHRVAGYTKIGGLPVYEFALQIPQVPSKPLKIVNEVMLLNNDVRGNLWINGYLIHGAIHRVKRALIVSATPVAGRYYNYPGPTGRTISRFFYGIESSNRTPLGIFTVADYEESGKTHDYGYAKNFGIAEEDHGPNFEVDCLVSAAHLIK